VYRDDIGGVEGWTYPQSTSSRVAVMNSRCQDRGEQACCQ
jgi:hypothetical protein